jgi:nicotinamide mononucleotide transporter
LKIILLGGLFTFLMGNFWMQFGAALPFTDAFTTVFSIIATILVARKNLENWLYWIVIDIVATGVYINREMYPTALLFFLYTLIAVFGWINWKNMIVQK